MGLQNWFSRVLMSTWFREITVIDIENLPTDRGAIIVSWHPGGLFDNMLTQGLLPGEQVKFDGFINNDDELEHIATEVASGKNVVDISFSPENIMKLNDIALQNNVTAIFDAGVAPGLPNYIFGYHDSFEDIKSFKYYVGGLPKFPKQPFNYKAPFSPIDVIEEYTRPARMIINGKLMTKPALSGIENINFKDSLMLEAFNTDGLRSLLYTMSHVKNMSEKTLRYPGHVKLIESYIEKGTLQKNETIKKLFKVSNSSPGSVFSTMLVNPTKSANKILTAE